MSDTMVRDLFGEPTEQKPLEVHEHSFITGPRANCGKRLVHSHADGEIPHQHPEAGPASYTIDQDDWARMTDGLVGGSRKRFTKAPEGEQLPRVELEDWQKSFEIVYGPKPQGAEFEGCSGGGHITAARMILAFRMEVSNVVPFPGPKRRSHV